MRSRILTAVHLPFAFAGLLLSNNLEAQSVLREYWLGIPGGAVSALTESEDFPGNPTGRTFPTSFQGPVDWADNYGTRMRAYVIPPVTGEYIFWISGDNNSELYLSTDEKAENRQFIAEVPNWTNYLEWDKFESQRSSPVFLTAGKRYYIEALHKEGAGGDSISVGWTLPGGMQERPIPGTRLETYEYSTEPPSIVSNPQALDLEEGESGEFSVEAEGAEPFFYQWQRNGQNIPAERNARLILTSVAIEASGDQFRCIVTNSHGEAVSQEALLTVVPETSPPSITRSNPPPGATVRSLTQVEVSFSEPVQGVDASDLRVNGEPAASVEGVGAGPYLFRFPALEPGGVTLAWAEDHEIVDLASIPNRFAGGSWEVAVEPTYEFPKVVISEFLASNVSGLRDNYGRFEDWIEIQNRSEGPVNLLGWSLTDDRGRPGKWVFPEVTLSSGERLIVFASGRDETISGSVPPAYHANFKLATGGEYLGLYGPESPRNVVDELPDGYPEQRSNYSYGRDDNDQWRYFETPTPLAPNGGTVVSGVSETPEFSIKRGFFPQPFDLRLYSPNPTATIRYTRDGSIPTPDHGIIYESPLHIESTSIVRAIAYQPGFLPSRVETHSYFVGPSEGLRSLPVISIVTDEDNLWGDNGIMEVNPRNTNKRGIAWERPASAEWISVEDNEGFQIDCGLRVAGGDWIRERYDPQGDLPFSKYSLRLYFRGDYGSQVLDYPVSPQSAVHEFNTLTLRAGMNDPGNPFVVDELVRRLSSDMGLPAAQGTFANLFVNGEYKGYYNPTERIDIDFLKAHLGEDGDWDLIEQFDRVREGDGIAWNQLRNLFSDRDMSDPSNYRLVEEQMDIDRFIDYLLLNVYCDTGDWPYNNWRAARKREPGSKWFFLVWDAEWALGNLASNVEDNTFEDQLFWRTADIANFYQSLKANSRFRLRFADRYHKHFLHGGALSPENVIARFDEIHAQMQDVLPDMDTSIRSNWVVERPPVMIEDLKREGLYASDFAPSFNQHGGAVQAGFELAMSAPEGDVYYTLDGTDPYQPSDEENTRVTLVGESAGKRVLVPDGGVSGTSWTGANEPYDDHSWTSGFGGVGYDYNPTYEEYIQTDLFETMNAINTSAWIRIPFEVDSELVEQLESLQLSLRYDDGFVAYLNGARIAEMNAPANPSWDAAATDEHADELAGQWEHFDVTPFLPELKSGVNILAVHGLNAGLESSDFLISAELSGTSSQAPRISQSARLYAGPISLNSSTLVKSRTLSDGRWSALNEATFEVNSPGLPIAITEIMYHPPAGSAYEFLELTNLGEHAIDMSGMYFEGIDFVFPTGFILDGGQSIILISNDDPAAFGQAYPGVPWAGEFGGRLSNKGERLTLFSRDGGIVTSVKYRDDGGWPMGADGEGASLELINPTGQFDDPANWKISDAPGGTPTMFLPTTRGVPMIRINELMAANASTISNEVASSDWIELFNAEDRPISLDGWTLTDDQDIPDKFHFPPNTVIDANGFLILWADDLYSNPGLHTGFALDSDGEVIVLNGPDGAPTDVVQYGIQIDGYTLGWMEGAWHLTRPTPNAANFMAELGRAASLRINEWMTNPQSGQDAWIELYNTDESLPVALQDLFFSSGDHWQSYRYRSFIAPGGFVSFMADGKFRPDHLRFEPAAQNSDFELLDSTGQRVDEVVYSDPETGVATGLLPDGSDNPVEFPGSASPGASNYLIDYTGPIFNEVLVAQTASRIESPGANAGWIEFFNPGPDEWDLSGYGLLSDIGTVSDWTFPAGVRLPAGAFLVIQCDASLPRSTIAETELNSGISLSLRSGVLRLLDPAGRIINELAYGFQIPGLSIGRNEGVWSLLETPTPNAENSRLASLGDLSNLRINEWLAKATFAEDFIEVFNSSNLPVELTGIHVTDDPSIAGENKYIAGPLSFIGPMSWVRWIADSDLDDTDRRLGFALNAEGEMIRLYDPELNILDEVYFALQSSNLSEGRYPDGEAGIFNLLPTPGESNLLAQINSDRDQDGIPDDWEIAHELNPDSAADALEDPDGDDFNNLGEYLSGTDPHDGEDVLALEVHHDPLLGVVLSFFAHSDRSYTIHSSESIAPSDWEVLMVIPPSAEEETVTVYDEAGLQDKHLFYKITVP